MLWKYNTLAKPIVTFYDSVIVNIISKYVWNCDPSVHVGRYQEFINCKKDSTHDQSCTNHVHLDIGPGSGYYLSESQKNTNTNFDLDLHLIDINEETLISTKKKFPSSHTTTHNVFLKPFPYGCTFDTIALNHVLHCVPGDQELMMDQMLGHLKSNMDDSTVFFGSTVAGLVPTERHSMSAIALITFLQELGIFHNQIDEEGMRDVLAKHFKRVETTCCGSEIGFVGRDPVF